MSGTFVTRQNQVENLRRRAAIQRLYGKAKFWTGLSLLLALVSVLATIANEHSDIEVASLVAGGVMLFDQLRVRVLQPQYVKKAVNVQEDFDCDVLGLPRDSLCRDAISPSDVLQQVRKKQRRTGGLNGYQNWYPVRLQEIPSGPAALLAQRCSVAWALRDVQQHATGLLVALVVVLVAPFIVAYCLNWGFQKSVLQILFPSLPFMVVFVQLHLQNAQAIQQLEALRSQVEGTWSTVVNQPHTNEGVISQARVFQNQLLELRKTLPLVPEWLYALRRKTNEEDMQDIADLEVDRYKTRWP